MNQHERAELVTLKAKLSQTQSENLRLKRDFNLSKRKENRLQSLFNRMFKKNLTLSKDNDSLHKYIRKTHQL